MVVEAWIDGVQKYIREGDEEWDNFYTGPCDEPWDGYEDHPGETYDKLSLQYLGSKITAQLRIPHIVAADRIEFLQEAPDVMYADQRPQFEGIGYNMVFEEGWDGWPESRKSTDTKKNPTYRPKGTMQASYPKVRYDTATAVRKTYWVYVGDTTYTYRTKAAMVETPYTFKHYFEPFDITFAGAKWEQGGSERKGFFDDDIEVFYTNTSVDVLKVIDQFTKSSVKFKVTYKDVEADTRLEKELSMEDFITNSQWYYDRLNQGPAAGGGNYSTFVAGLLKGTDGLRLTPDGNTSIFNYGADRVNPDDNEQAWIVRLDYAPIAYSQQGARTPVDVPVQLYVLDDATVLRLGGIPWVERKGNDLTTTVAQMGAIRDFRPVTANLRGEFDVIADKWALTGSYTGSKFLTPNKQDRTIPLTKQMLYAGYGVASWLGVNSTLTEITAQLGAGSVKAFPNQILTQVGANASMWNSSIKLNYGHSLDDGDFITAFPLPLYYRELYEEGEDGVLINLQY